MRGYQRASNTPPPNLPITHFITPHPLTGSVDVRPKVSVKRGGKGPSFRGVSSGERRGDVGGDLGRGNVSIAAEFARLCPYLATDGSVLGCFTSAGSVIGLFITGVDGFWGFIVSGLWATHGVMSANPR